jgi:maltose O-acetyltransferase
MYGALISSAHHLVKPQPPALNGILWALARAIRSDLNNPGGRYLYLENWVRGIPGEIGFEIRRWMLGRYFKKHGPGLRLFPGVRLFGVDQLAVGQNCWIGLDNVIQANGGVEIGDNVLLGPGVKIWSVNHVYSDPKRTIVEQGFEQRRVVIGSNVWIGANAFIMPGARISDGVVISAGSVVGAKVIEPYSVMAGNPARKIGSRLPREESSRFAPPDNLVQKLLTV